MGKADEVVQQMAVPRCEGPSVLYGHPSLSAAEGSFEAIDVENDEYVFFGQDGTVIQPSVESGHVVLTAAHEQRVDELGQGIRTSLAVVPDDGVSLSPPLTDTRRSSDVPAGTSSSRLP